MVDIPDILNVFAVVATSLILAYVAFWALTVRRALLVPVYMREALGVALIAVLLALSNVVVTAEGYLYLGGAFGAIGQGAFGLFFVFLLVLFYWVDSSVRAVRRSDPLGRDTFHWSKLRLVLWAFSLPGQVLVVAVSIIGAVTSGLASTAASSAPSAGWIGLLLTVVLVGAIGIPIFSAAVMLPVIARRTADLTFRSQLIWFGAFGITYVILCNQLGNDSIFPSDWYNLFFGYLGLAICAYCLYRSVSSLIPTFRPLLATGAQVGPARGVGKGSPADAGESAGPSDPTGLQRKDSRGD